MKRLFLTALATLISASPSFSQSIDIGTLGVAKAYEPGALKPEEQALGQNLWVGTSAETALNLMERLPQNYQNDLARDLVRLALLSPGVPPQGKGAEDFTTSRLQAIIKLADMAAAEHIARRTGALASSRNLQADMALISGKLDEACSISDSIVEERGLAYWMKLRAFCHVIRDEAAAAELTLDLLASSEETDIAYDKLIRHLTGVEKPDLKGLKASPLNIAMINKSELDWPTDKEPPLYAATKAYNVNLSPEKRLDALFFGAQALSDNHIKELLTRLGEEKAGNLAGGAGLPAQPNLDSIIEDKSAKGYLGLYTLIQFSQNETRDKALIEFLRRIEKKGQLSRFVDFLEPFLVSLSYSDLHLKDIPLLARVAILRGDIFALQQIHSSLSSHTSQTDGQKVKIRDRIALAADALGNGFYGENLGTDIDTRLSKPDQQARALRDSLLAHALGANISDTAFSSLEEKSSLGRMSGAMLALSAAANKGSQAETALRAALLLENANRDSKSNLTMFYVIDSLYRAGIREQAAQLAALDFISDI